MTQLIPSFHDYHFHSKDDCCTIYPFSVQEIHQTMSTGEDPGQVFITPYSHKKRALRLRIREGLDL